MTALRRRSEFEISDEQDRGALDGDVYFSSPVDEDDAEWEEQPDSLDVELLEKSDGQGDEHFQSSYFSPDPQPTQVATSANSPASDNRSRTAALRVAGIGVAVVVVAVASSKLVSSESGQVEHPAVPKESEARLDNRPRAERLEETTRPKRPRKRRVRRSTQQTPVRDQTEPVSPPSSVVTSAYSSDGQREFTFER